MSGEGFAALRFPVEHRRLVHTDLLGHVPLEQAQIQPSLADMIPQGPELAGISPILWFQRFEPNRKKATRPCRCGYHGDPRHECTCTPKQIQQYMSRISGPLLDRIDIQIEVPAVSYKEIAAESDAESSSEIQERVVAARSAQLQRFGETATGSNARMTAAQVKTWCNLDVPSQRLLEQAIARLGLSARGWNRILKVARTVADLSDSGTIGPSHLAEAIRYRRLHELC